jgi:hypothetical protein
VKPLPGLVVLLWLIAGYVFRRVEVFLRICHCKMYRGVCPGTPRCFCTEVVFFLSKLSNK